MLTVTMTITTKTIQTSQIARSLVIYGPLYRLSLLLVNIAESRDNVCQAHSICKYCSHHSEAVLHPILVTYRTGFCPIVAGAAGSQTLAYDLLPEQTYSSFHLTVLGTIQRSGSRHLLSKVSISTKESTVLISQENGRRLTWGLKEDVFDLGEICGRGVWMKINYITAFNVLAFELLSKLFY